MASTVAVPPGGLVYDSAVLGLRRSQRWARGLAESSLFAAIAVVCAVSLLSAGEAHASKGKGPLKVVLFKLGGDAPAKRKKSVLATIRASLSSIGRTPITNAAALEDTITVLGCDPRKASCIRLVTGEIEADEVVGGSLSIVEDAVSAPPEGDPRKKKKKKKKKKSPDVRLELVMANKTGRIVHRESVVIPGDKTGAKLAALVDPLVENAVARSHGVITVTSNPGGADVIIDGTHRGTTPVEVELMVGGHSLDVIGGAAESSRSINVRHTGGELLVDLTIDDTDVVDDDKELALDEEGDELAEPPPPRDLDDDGSDDGKKKRKKKKKAKKTGTRTAGTFKFDVKRISMLTIITGAAGAGVVVIGVILGSASLGLRGSYVSRAENLRRPILETDLPELREVAALGARGKALAITADVFYVLGGAAIITAGVLAYLDMRTEPASGAAGDLPALRLGPVEARADIGWFGGGPGARVELRW